MPSNAVFFASNELINKTDEDLVSLIKQENEEALDFLMKKYKELVVMKIAKYFIIGAEKEDIYQEGMIGLYKAIKSFKPDKDNSFKSFANLCIERQLITAIKSSTRQKHQPLNSYLSINTAAYEDDENTPVMEVLDTNTTEDPLDTVMKKEYYSMVESKINETLSDFEKKVLGRYVSGESYVQIAEKLDAPLKSIDNAIQRIRKKATKSIMEDETI